MKNIALAFLAGVLGAYLLVTATSVRGASQTWETPVVNGCTEWTWPPGYYTYRNMICAGTLHFGDEVIQGRPEDLKSGKARQRMLATGTAPMLAIESDSCWACTNPLFKPNILSMDGEAAPTPHLLGVNGQQNAYEGNWRVQIMSDSLCFAPNNGGKQPNFFDVCIGRDIDGRMTLRDAYGYYSLASLR